MQDESYQEESVTMCDEARARGKTKYTLCALISVTSAVFALLSLFFLLLTQFTAWIMLIPTAICGFLFFFFRYRKDRYVFDCDYIFVSGSVRIAKILNGRKRKALTVFESSDVESIGQYESEKYNSYSHMPDIKKIIATPNVGYHDDKIFYCYYPHNGQRTLLLFEPSNVLLLSISKSAKKNIFNV